MIEILQYSFIQNAIAAAILSGICCGIVGSYMVARRLVFLGGGITHSSLGGIGLAYWAGFDTTLGALAAAIISAFSIDYLASPAKQSKSAMSEDSATSIIWSAGMALGVIFIFLTPGYAPNLMTFLFGNLLLTTTSQILWLGIFDLVLIVSFAVFGRLIVYTALDAGYSASQRVNVRMINILMLIVISVAIVLNIRILGIVLMISMLTVPVIVAKTIARRYRAITMISSALAIVAALAGLVLSYLFDIPSSATSVVMLVALLIVSRAIKLLCRRSA